MRIFSAIHLLLCFAFASAVAAAPPRLALLSTAENEDAKAVLDLAFVELSQQGGLEIVERSEIKRIVREHKLALQQQDAGLEIGRLLRADLIGILEAPPKGEGIGGFSVTDGALGVVYANRGLASDSVPELAQEVIEAVQSSLKKEQDVNTGNTVCILSANNTEFARTKDRFCTTVAYLLERKLSDMPSVASLNRRHVDALLSEDRLTPGSAKSKLLPSLRMLELDFLRSETEGQIKVTLRLSDSDSKELATQSVEGPDQPIELAKLLGSALAAMLKIPPGDVASDPKREAKRFRNQGNILWKRGLKEQAMQPLYAAFALDPGSNTDKEEFVIKILEMSYTSQRAGNAAEALSQLREVFDLEEQYDVVRNTLTRAHTDYALWVISRCKKIPRNTPLWQEFDELRRRYRDRLVSFYTAPTAKQEKTSSLRKQCTVPYQTYSYRFEEKASERVFPVTPAYRLTLDQKELFSLIQPWVTTWLEKEKDPKTKHNNSVYELIKDLPSKNYLGSSRSFGDISMDDAFVNTASGIYEKFAEHPRVIVQLLGRYGKLSLDLSYAAQLGKPWTVEARTKEAKKLIELVMSHTDQPDNLPEGDLRHLYELATHLAGMVPVKDDDQYKTLNGIMDRMLNNGHLAQRAFERLLVKNSDYDKYRGPMIERYAATRGNPAYKVLEDNKLKANRYTRERLNDYVQNHRPPAKKAEALAAEKYPSAWWYGLTNVLQRDKTLALPGGGIWNPDFQENPWERAALLTREGSDYVYGFWGNLSGHHGSHLEIKRFDTASYNAVEIAQLDLKTFWKRWSRDRRIAKDALLTDSLVTNGILYISTSGSGIYGFPTSGQTPPFSISTSNGLPSDVCHGFTVVGDLLYAGCGAIDTDGYFIEYNLKTKDCKVIASTLRSTPKTPLDKLKSGFFVSKIIPDMQRKRLLVFLENGAFDSQTGLWEYKLSSNTFEQILDLNCPAERVDLDEDGTLWIQTICRQTGYRGGSFSILAFHPDYDYAQLVYASKKIGAGPKLPIDQYTVVDGRIDHIPAAIIGDWMYHFKVQERNDKTETILNRLNLKTGNIELVVGPEVVSKYHDCWSYLEWVPKHRFLLMGSGTMIKALKIPVDKEAQSKK